MLKKHKSGYLIVTNAHVIEGMDQVFIYLKNKNEAIEVEVLASDPDLSTGNHSDKDIKDILSAQQQLDLGGSDLALLFFPGGLELHPVKIGSYKALNVGEPVIAIGNPVGLGLSTTYGVVSAKERAFLGVWIQVSAPLSPGNSGGGLFNLRGELVGINTMKKVQKAVENIGFAIDIETVLNNVEEMLKNGKIRRAGFGYSILLFRPSLPDRPSGLDCFSGFSSKFAPE